MDSDGFLQAHAKWKYGKATDRKPESPRTWLMAESGFYYVLEGDLDSELKRYRENGLICTVHHNQTSISMSHIQAEHERQ